MPTRRERPPGFFWVLRQLVVRYFRHQVGRSAAELSYYLLFSLFPFLIFLNAVISMLHLSLDDIVHGLGGVVLPAQAAELLSTYLSYIQGLDTRVLLYACLFLTFYAVSRSVRSLTRAVSTAYQIPHQGPANAVLSAIFTVLLLLSILALLVLLMISENLLRQLDNYITVPEFLLRIWNILRLAVGPVLLCLLLTCFYFGVGYGRYRFWQALPGAAFAVVVWFVVTSGFSYYMGHVSRYSIIYGSLAAIMMLMLWFYLTGAVLILGGELNHILIQLRRERLEHQGGAL